MDIIDKINILIEDKYAHQSGSYKKTYARKKYRLDKKNIKDKKEKLKRSAEGKKRERMEDEQERKGNTPTGKRKVKYNIIKRKT